MKAIRFFIVVCLGFFLLTSCAMVMTPEQRACYQVPPEESKLCEFMGKYWEETNSMLRITNAVMLQEDVYEAETALKVINELDAMLTTPTPGVDPIHYSYFMKKVAELAGPLVAVTINEAIKQYFSLDLPITEFDKSLIRNELAQHRLVVELSLASNK